MSLFQKRHYEAIAAMFRENFISEAAKPIQHHPLEITEFLRLFREDNPAFDAEKFLSACKPRR